MDCAMDLIPIHSWIGVNEQSLIWLIQKMTLGPFFLFFNLFPKKIRLDTKMT
jgi:hypothetical protein